MSRDDLALIGMFAVGSAVVFAFAADFTFLYFRYMDFQMARWRRENLKAGFRSWDQELTGLSAQSSTAAKKKTP